MKLILRPGNNRLRSLAVVLLAAAPVLNSTTDSTVPVRIPGLTGITAIAAGNLIAYALKSDGTVRAWGNNDFGQLGNNSTGLFSDVPVQASALTGVTAIAGGWGSEYALKSDGTVWAWGNAGGLGKDSNPFSPVPVRVRGL